MKVKILLIVCMSWISVHIKAQENAGFTLNGKFKGLPDRTTVYLVTEERDTVARALSKNDEFILKGTLPLEGRFHYIRIDSLVTKQAFTVFLVNNSISVNGVIGEKKIVVSGSQGHLDYVDIVNQQNDFQYKRDKANEARSKYVAASLAGDSTEFNKLRSEWEQIDEELNKQNTEMAIRWIESHPSSLYTPKVIELFRRVLGENGTQKAFDHLMPKAKASYYGVKLKHRLKTNELSSKIFKGSIIPNFSIVDPEGNEMFIHDLASKYKYTLIDVWASWCSPCRAEVPKLKKVYADYKNKGLNILGVSSDLREGAWKKALKEDGTIWVHGIQKDSKDVSMMFDLKAIPAYILIDNKGKLIAFDCGMSSIPNFGPSIRGEELLKTLDTLLNEKRK